MILLGIDPGIANCGFAAIKRLPDKTLRIQYVSRVGTPAGTKERDRIGVIGNELYNILTQAPNMCIIDGVGIEGVFFSRNKSSAMKVAQVIGALKYICYTRKKPVEEFLPNEIKLTLGVPLRLEEGVDPKEAMEIAIARQDLPGVKPTNSHERDAVAVALTYFRMLKESQ